VALVPAGDNPDARILLWKSRRDRLHDALEHRPAAGEEIHEKGGTMSTVMKAEDAGAELAKLVKERRAAVPTESEAQAFAKVTARGEPGRRLLIAMRSEGPDAEDAAMAKAFPQ
jgi:hypothetical protein